MFKSYRLYIFVFILSLLLVNCEKNSTDPKENNIVPANVPSEVVGSWDAVSYLVSNNDNASDIVDLVQEGFGLLLTIQSNGSYTSIFSIPNMNDETESGTLTFINNTVTIDPPGEDPFIMAYQVTDTLLTLVDPNSSYDFDDDGMDEDATETIILVKQ